MVVVREGFSVQLDAEQVRRAITQAPKALALEMRAALTDLGTEHRRIARTMFVPRVGDNAGPDRLQYRGGGLYRSLGSRTLGSNLSDLGLVVFGDGSVVYGPTQEFGDANRKPVNAQYMTIPLRDALTPAGRLKGGMRLVKRGNRWYTASGMSTRVITASGGRKFIVGTTGYSRVQRALGRQEGRVGNRQPASRTLNQKRQDVLLYALKKQVRIPARPFFGRAWDETQSFRQERFQRALDNAIGQIGFSDGT